MRLARQGKRAGPLEIHSSRCYAAAVAADLEIRRARPGDLPCMAALWLETAALQRLGDPRLQLAPDAARRREAAMRDWLEDPAYCLLVALTGSQIAGYIIGCERAAPPGLLPQRRGHVLEMTLDPHSDVNGPGGVLWPELCRWFQQRGLNEVIVHASARQPVEQAFWRSLAATELTDLFWMKL